MSWVAERALASTHSSASLAAAPSPSATTSHLSPCHRSHDALPVGMLRPHSVADAVLAACLLFLPKAKLSDSWFVFLCVHAISSPPLLTRNRKLRNQRMQYPLASHSLPFSLPQLFSPALSHTYITVHRMPHHTTHPAQPHTTPLSPSTPPHLIHPSHTNARASHLSRSQRIPSFPILLHRFMLFLFHFTFIYNMFPFKTQ